MQLKYVYVKNDLTGIYYIIMQVEDCDMHFFSKIGIGSGYKIVCELVGGRVGAAVGNKFIPEYIESSIPDRSRKIEPTLTAKMLGLYLNNADNIRDLPDEIDLEKLNNVWMECSNQYNTIKSDLEKLYDEKILVENINYRKVLYKTNYGSVKFSIIDENYEDIYSQSIYKEDSSGYLWCPFDILTDNEWDVFCKKRYLQNVCKL